MIELILNDNNVIIENNKSLKFTRENTYFTNSSDYTFEIQIPMSLIENKALLGNVQRIDHKHEFSEMKATLTVDNIPLIRGKAKVVKCDNKTLTVQVLGNKSAYKDLFDKTYIDTLKYDAAFGTPQDWNTQSKITHYIGDPNKMLFYRVHDTTNDIYNNCIAVVANKNKLQEQQTWFVGPQAPQPNLLYIIQQVCQDMGFKIDMSPINYTPLNHIYIASARTWYYKGSDKDYGYASVALPHWTVTEFIEQIQYFFNITIKFDSTKGIATIMHNTEMVNAQAITIVPEEDYSIDVSDDEKSNKSLASSNLRYDIETDDSNKYDCIDDTLFNNFEQKKYDSYTLMLQAYNKMDDSVRGQYIWVCPSGQYIRTGDIDSNHAQQLMQINKFGTLWRNSEIDDIMQLKIVPADIEPAESSTDKHVIILPFNDNIRNNEWAYLSHIFHSDNGYWMQEGEQKSAHNISYSDYKIAEPEYLYAPAIKITQPRQQRRAGNANLSIIEDGEGVFDTSDRLDVSEYLLDNSKASDDAEDRMHVFFVDDNLDLIKPTVDISYMVAIVQVPFVKNYDSHVWSMSLNDSAGEFYVGQLHKNNYSFNMKSLHTIKFLSKKIPDPSSLFIINNKRYACQKIEVNIANGYISEEITGYFYEMK